MVPVGAGRSVEGPVAGGDGGVVHDGDGAVEHVEGEGGDPAVPVTLVELVAGVGVAEEPGALADLGPQVVVYSRELRGAVLAPAQPGYD